MGQAWRGRPRVAHGGGNRGPPTAMPVSDGKKKKPTSDSKKKNAEKKPTESSVEKDLRERMRKDAEDTDEELEMEMSNARM